MQYHPDTILLFEAAEKGDSDALRDLLDGSTLDIDVTDEHDRTAIIFAAHHGNPDAVQVLIDAGANINQTSAVGWTAAHDAAFHGNARALKVLIDSDADIHQLDNDKSTPLLLAIQNNQNDCAYILIKSGAQINETGNTLNWTPLMYAIAKNNLRCVEMLLEADADLTHQAQDGSTALELAQYAKNEDIKTIIETAYNRMRHIQKLDHAQEKKTQYRNFRRFIGKRPGM